MKVVSIIPNTTYVSGTSVNDFASYLKITLADDSTIATLCYDAAIQYIAGLTWRNFTGKVVSLIGYDWLDGEYEIDISGTLSTIAVTYFDTTNVSQTLTLDADEYFLERTDQSTSILHITPDTYPELYDRADAIKVTLTLAGSDNAIDKTITMLIYQIGAYFYDCRVNDKEPQMTVVDKMVMAIRMKEF